MILCKRGCPEQDVSQTPELIFYSGTVGHSNVDVDFQYTLGLQSQSIDSANAFSQAYIPSGGPVFIELPREFNIDGGQGDVVI